MVSLAQPLALFVLGWFAWTPIQAGSFAELSQRAVHQSASALNVLWFVATLLPAIGAGIALIPLCFYHLNDHDVQLMAAANAGKLPHEQAVAQLSPRIQKEVSINGR